MSCYISLEASSSGSLHFRQPPGSPFSFFFACAHALPANRIWCIPPYRHKSCTAPPFPRAQSLMAQHWRAADAAAPGAAGVGGHPVESPVQSRPVYGLSAWYERRPHGIWQSVMCLRVWPALLAAAPLPRGAGIAEDVTEAEMGFFAGRQMLDWLLANRDAPKTSLL